MATIELYDKLNNPGLSKVVKTGERFNLKVFFTAKAHKDDILFRAIVSARGTWQRHGDRFIQRHLSVLSLDDTLRVKSQPKLRRTGVTPL